MQPATRTTWAAQDRHPGDRLRLFTALAEVYPAASVLYPGSFVDVAASFVFDSVTYVDMDRRAARFFGDTSGVDELIADHRQPGRWRFIHSDYTADLGLTDEAFDGLISLYAGFISEACTRYLRPGGWLLANPSHGDVAMASIDPRYELAAVVKSSAHGYRVDTTDLDQYLIPKRPGEVTRASLRRSGRGIAYTRSPFAYVFRHTNI